MVCMSKTGIPSSIELIVSLDDDIEAHMTIEDENEIEKLDEAIDTYYSNNVGSVLGMDVEEVNVEW